MTTTTSADLVIAFAAQALRTDRPPRLEPDIAHEIGELVHELLPDLRTRRARDVRITRGVCEILATAGALVATTLAALGAERDADPLEILRTYAALRQADT